MMVITNITSNYGGHAVSYWAKCKKYQGVHDDIVREK